MIFTHEAHCDHYEASALLLLVALIVSVVLDQQIRNQSRPTRLVLSADTTTCLGVKVLMEQKQIVISATRRVEL